MSEVKDKLTELMPIMQAYIDGKTIQWQSNDGEWQDDDYFDPMEHPGLGYRVKPEKTKWRLGRGDVIECPGCGEITFTPIAVVEDDDVLTTEYECRLCPQVGFFDEKTKRNSVDDILWDEIAIYAIDYIHAIDMQQCNPSQKYTNKCLVSLAEAVTAYESEVA